MNSWPFFLKKFFKNTGVSHGKRGAVGTELVFLLGHLDFFGKMCVMVKMLFGRGLFLSLMNRCEGQMGPHNGSMGVKEDPHPALIFIVC